jgi:SAM-dependent methyltransferase
VETERFLERRAAPVHQNMLFPSAETARAMNRGSLDMRLCTECGFVFNAAFDPALMDYGPAYENSQDCSPAFDAYLDELVELLVRGHGLTTGRVVEVGCGKGVFLRKLLAHPDNHCEAVGYDPSYLGPERPRERARLVKDFYTPATAVPADAVVCRHVIEHIPEPLGLLRTVRAGVGDSGVTRVFFETPCVEWILRNRVLWDFFYEHCSIFTAGSLALALENAGFEVSAVRHVFGGQYLWAEGSSGPARKSRSKDSSEMRSLARAFATDERERVARWNALLEEHSSRGPVFAWGAGAKGVTFCNLVDPDKDRLAGVVDVNPSKQGKYLPGTGHPIVSPGRAVATGAAAFLLFNPNYAAEVRSELQRLGSSAVVVDLMREGSSAAANAG